MKKRFMRKSFRSLLSAALVLIMVISTIGVIPALADETSDGGAVQYVPAASMSEGTDVVIVTEQDGVRYAMSFDGAALGSEQVTLEDGAITLTDKSAVWTVREENTLESAGTPGSFIFAGSGGFMVFSGGRTVVYDPDSATIFMHNLYYLTFDADSGQFGQSTESADACRVELYSPAVTFTRSDSMTEGYQYIISTTAGGKTYALSIDNSALSSEEVTVDGDTASASMNAVWYSREGDTVENAAYPDMYIFAGSGGFMIFTGGRTFVYDSSSGTVFMHNLYYLTFDPATGLFGQSTEAADACEVTIYEHEMEAEEAEEIFVPDGSDLPCIVKDAGKNDDGSITLAFVSDVHYSVDYEQNNLEVWLNNVLPQVGHVDSFGSLGDMGSAYSSTPEIYWDNAQGVIDTVQAKIDEGLIDDAVFTFGNHEWYPVAGGDFMNNYENDTAKSLMRVGEALRTDDYIFYALGAGSIAAQYSQGYSDEDIARVDEYLSTAPTDIPIFVLTHFPLHFWGDRLTRGNDALIDVFNKYPNVVLLWGHNHSDFDEYYDNVYRPGSSIVIDQNGTARTINFTYLSAGCISDLEYTGAHGGSAWVQGKGLICTINADGTLTFNYYDMQGDRMEELGPYLVEFREGVNCTTLSREYVDAGQPAEAPEVPEIYHYRFTGWDNDFDHIAEHLVVTAEYEFVANRDENYVYLTLTDGTDAVTGKSGQELVFYPVPYTENMTVGDAFQIMQDAEYDGDQYDIVYGGYGGFNDIFGQTPENGAFALCLDSESGYVQASAMAVPGDCYYMTLFTSADEQYTPSYLSPEETTAEAGADLSFLAYNWVPQANYTYVAEPMSGDVYVGTSLSDLTDTGIDAVDGMFTLPVEGEEDFYVVVVSEGLAANAYAKIHISSAEAPAETDANDAAEDAAETPAASETVQSGIPAWVVPTVIGLVVAMVAVGVVGMMIQKKKK